MSVSQRSLRSPEDWKGFLVKAKVKHHDRKHGSWWCNDDIKPLPPARRTWSYWTYCSWWSVWLLGITNFQLGSSLVSSGLSIWQTMAVTVIGRVLTALLAVLLGQVGGKWHIPFPVYSRAVWGFRGSFIPVALRVFAGLIGYAIQSWLGALNVTAVLDAIFPSFYRIENTLPASANVTTKNLIGWVVFNIALAPALLLPPEKARKPMVVSVLISFTTLLAMTIWAGVHSQRLGSIWTSSSALQTASERSWSMVSGITTVIGATAPALIGQADFSRFSRRPSDQVYGQVFSFVVVGCVMPLLGCVMSSATQTLYGQAIWNPTALLNTWLTTTGYSSGARTAAAFAGLGLAISQYSLSVVDSAYSIGIDMSGLFPRWFTIRRGAYFGLIISIAVCPWELLTSGLTFIAVISSLVVFFAGVMGIMTADYWIVRGQRVQLAALYQPHPGNVYWYFSGFNLRAAAAWICSFAPLLPGMIATINRRVEMPAGIIHLYQMTFFWAFVVAFLVYWALCAIFPVPCVQDEDSDGSSVKFSDNPAQPGDG